MASSCSPDALAAVQQKVGTVTKVMQENVDAALLHCDRLESIELNAQELDQSAAVFRDRARQLRLKLWWRSVRMKLAAAGAFVLVVIGTLVAVAVLAVQGEEQ